MKKLLESGALGLGTAALAQNPELLRGFGVVGNIAANKMDDREEKKKSAGTPAMKKGGYVKQADGCAKRGKTKGRMV
jgi:hypothetical protein